MILDYDHIKDLAQKRGYTLNTIGPKLALSAVGFRKAIRNETLSLSHALQLAKLLRVNIYDLVINKEYVLNIPPSILNEPVNTKDVSIINEVRDLKDAVVKLEEKIINHLKTNKSQKSQN